MRMRWCKRITEVFGLSVADIVKYIDGEISSTGLDTDCHPGERIKGRLVTFLQADNA